MDFTELQFVKMSSRAVVPTRATKYSIGVDLHSPDNYLICPKIQVLIPTQIKLGIPPESEFFQKTGRKARLQNHNCAQVVLHWEMHLMHQLHQEHTSQHVRTLESQTRGIMNNFTCKDTIATWISGLPVKNVEL